jgi:ferredoxin-NADP reductase
MSSSPDTGDPFTTTVKRMPGGPMSNWMNDRLAPGDTIEVMRPVGLFVLRQTDVPIFAFAGGSGITPVLSIIKSALATTARPIALVYANRSTDSIIFAGELERLRAASGGRLSVHHHLDSERGFLDPAACAALARDRAHADFYICGPAPYMETVEAGLSQLGVAEQQRFIERFVVPTEAPAKVERSVTESVVIRLDRRKHALRYQPGDTVLDAARRGGLRPPFSCESGSCATCMAHLDAGSVQMRVNNALSADEVADGWILTCQAIPTSPEVVVSYDA